MDMMWTTHRTHTYTHGWVEKEQMGHGHTHTLSCKYRPFLCIISRAISMKDGVITDSPREQRAYLHSLNTDISMQTIRQETTTPEGHTHTYTHTPWPVHVSSHVSAPTSKAEIHTQLTEDHTPTSFFFSPWFMM